MEGKTYGYIRVSSKDQYIDRQLIAFAESDFNLPKKQIYIDKISGKIMSNQKPVPSTGGDQLHSV